MPCILATAVIIAVSIYLWHLNAWNMWWITPLICTISGTAFGGTNGFRNDWDPEDALLGCVVGFLIGCSIAVIFGDSIVNFKDTEGQIIGFNLPEKFSPFLYLY